MECWSNGFSFLPILLYSITPLIALPANLPHIYPWVGLCSGYALVMFFTPVRTSLRDGFRCVTRFPRICITYVVFGIAYSIFHFATLSPLQNSGDLDLT